MATASLIKKYKMYQAAVQDPHQQIRTFKKAFCDNFDYEPLVLKEDFSGTFWISSEWVKLGAHKVASAIDLSKEVLDVGRVLHYDKLSSPQKKRLHIYQQDVSAPGKIKADIVAGCNFSFFIFRERQKLLNYFKGAKASLKKNGIFTNKMKKFVNKVINELFIPSAEANMAMAAGGMLLSMVGNQVENPWLKEIFNMGSKLMMFQMMKN
jgi:hypothetical protein